MTLSVAGVSEALLVAILAALLDAAPLAGATLATVPAVVLALVVSPTTGVVVLVLFLIYQQIENQLIVPTVFRHTLQISSLVILIAVLFGVGLPGVIGALLALPVAAAIPAVARVWKHPLDDMTSLEDVGPRREPLVCPSAPG